MELIGDFLIFAGLALVANALQTVADAVRALFDRELQIRGVR